MAFITVFSGEFCSAEEIVQNVAKKLGYNVFGSELIERASKNFDFEEEKLARAMTGYIGRLNRLTHDWEKSLVYIKSSLADILKTNDQIYHGPAAHLIPENITHVLRVGITADQDYRVEQAKRQMGLGAKGAAIQIQKGDQELAKWMRQTSSVGPWDAKLYDVKIPLPSNSINDAVDIICKNKKRDALIPTENSIQAVLDFQLAMRVNLELLNQGHYNCGVKVDKGKASIFISQKTVPTGALARTFHSIRFENLETDVHKIAKGIPGVSSVEIFPGAGPAKKIRTLLVDDQQDFVVTLSERLDIRNIPSDVVFGAEEALTYVNTNEPDVMVLDLNMPGLGGLEVLKRIKKDHPSVEVIIVTGHGEENTEEAAINLGAFAYLKKPVDINILSKKIEEASQKVQQALGEEEDKGKDR